MGFLKRAAGRSTDRFWASLSPLTAGEQRVDYAHLVLVLDTGDEPGTAYVTTERLFWQPAEGSIVAFELATCDGFAVRDDRPGQTGIAAGFPTSTRSEPFVVVLFPQQPKSAANRRLAGAFVQSLARQLLRHHPEWGLGGQ